MLSIHTNTSTIAGGSCSYQSNMGNALIPPKSFNLKKLTWKSPIFRVGGPGSDPHPVAIILDVCVPVILSICSLDGGQSDFVDDLVRHCVSREAPNKHNATKCFLRVNFLPK